MKRCARKKQIIGEREGERSKVPGGESEAIKSAEMICGEEGLICVLCCVGVFGSKNKREYKNKRRKGGRGKEGRTETH